MLRVTFTLGLASLLVAGFAGQASAKKKKPRYPSQIEIEVTSGYHPGTTGPYFAEGDAGAARPSCGNHRTVQLHVIKDGVDSILGTDVTEYPIGMVPGGAEGNWHIDTTHPVGPFQIYAVVLRKMRPHSICKRAATPPLLYP